MTTNLLSETIKEINDIKDKLKKLTALKLMQCNKNSTQVSE
jgi:hypothetical protein